MELLNTDFVAYYNDRYTQGYQNQLNGYEYARWAALRSVLRIVMRDKKPMTVLDYGCGSGLFTPLLKELFPNAEIWGCDISIEALNQFDEQHPNLATQLELIQGDKDQSSLPDNSVDLCISVEVMEHVQDIDQYLNDITRILKPSGVFVWTTPCANPFSLESIIAGVTKKIRQTSEGYRVWTWEDPGHLRRLRSAEVADLLSKTQLRCKGFRFRAHAFSFFCDKLLRRFPRHASFWEKLMLFDYILFRRLPNAASMIGWAIKH
jgi:ubiquinone/menaquinone biosynthesis C-methylase UbiE